MIQKLKRTWSESGSVKSFVFLLFVFVCTGILQLITSRAFGEVTESVVQRNLIQTKSTLLLFVVGTLITLVVIYGANVYQTRLIERMRQQFKTKTVTNLLESSYDFSSKQEQGDLIGRLGSDVSSMVSATNMSITLLKACILLVILSLGILAIDWRLMLLFVILLPIALGVQFYASKQSSVLILPWKKAMGKTNALTQDIMNNRTTIRTFGLYQTAESWVEDALESSAQKGIHGIRSLYFIQAPFSILVMLPLFLIGIGGTYLIAQGQMQVSQMVSVFILVQLASNEFNVIANMLQNIPQLLVSTERIFPIWDAPREAFGHEVGEVADAPLIAFKNLNFRYAESKTNVLNNFNLEIKEGEHLGIVGTSGSGKSTLANLLLGLYTPTTGTVSFKGTSIQQWDKEVLRNQLAVVSQNSDLMNQSIRENILYGNAHAPDAEIMECLEKVQLSALVQTQGLDYVVGEKGNRLSGGQRQRLAIARALIKKSPVLLFDEATSALDAETEQVIQSIMDQSTQTQIIIAHRLSTLRNCNRIVVLDQGSIAESGTHDELIQKQGIYAHLIAKQKGEADDETETID